MDGQIFEPLDAKAGKSTAGAAAAGSARSEGRLSAAGGPLDRCREASRTSADRALDLALRPRRFEEFIGQRRTLQNLALYVEATRRRNKRTGARFMPLDHVLLTGLPGLGKTTLAHLVAREVGAGIRSTSGPAIDKPGDLAGILTNLEEGEVLFIDEVHRLPPVVEEYLYAAMTDFSIDIVIDQGPAARTIKIDLKPFTLVAATTREGLLTAPFRSRFGVMEKLEPYPPEDLQQIVLRSSGLLGVEIDPACARRLADVSRGTPRTANRFVRRMRDVAEVYGDGRIDEAIVDRGLEMLGIDGLGLDATDRRIVEFLCRQGGEPVGLKTIAVAVGEDETTIEEVYEPFLIRKGLLHKTPRGRRPARRAFDHIRVAPPPSGGGAVQRTLL